MTMNDGAPERAGNAIVRLGSRWVVSAEPHVMPAVIGGKPCAVACLSVYL